MQLFQQQYRIIGSFGSPLGALGRALDRIASGVRPVIDTVYALEDFRAGLARLEEPRRVRQDHRRTLNAPAVVAATPIGCSAAS